MDDYESVALVKPEVFVYRIPPIQSNQGHKAADWKLDNPDWTGRLKVVAIGQKLELRLEDKSSGALYAKCPVDQYPGPAIETVKDSSRYFVIRLRNDTGQTAFVGCGFADRSDSFDLNVALQDHFKYLEKSAEMEQKLTNSGPALDLAFKEGQTISISLKKNTDGQAAPSRPRPAAASSGGLVPLLPPPPGAGSSVRPRGTAPVTRPAGNDSLFSFRNFYTHHAMSLLRPVSPNQVPMDERMPFQIPRRVDRHAHFDSMESFPRPTQQATPVALRRLTRDYQRLQQEPLPGIHALPCEENILEWHYCIEGSKDTPFYGGFYHGKVVFQPDFPWKPPSICMITPNGRFRINMRLCLSISDYHPEQWNPGWTVSSILLGLHSFMNEDGVAAGAITDSVEVRRELAAKSKEFNLANPEFCRMFPTLAMSFRTSSAQLAISDDDSSSTPSSDRARSQSRKRKLCEEVQIIYATGQETLQGGKKNDTPQAKEPLKEEKKNDTPQAKGSFEEEKKPVGH